MKEASNKQYLNELMIRLEDVEKINGDVEFQFKQQLTLTYLLFIVKGGNGSILIDKHEYKVKKDSFVFCAPEQTFGVFSHSEEIELFLFRFNIFQQTDQNATMSLLKDENLFINHGVLYKAYSKKHIAFQCEEILTKWFANKMLNRYHCQISFQALLYDIFMQNFEQEEGPLAAIERTKEYMDAHYHEKLTIEELSRMANFSPNYFVDLFKKIYGKCVTEYLTDVKIDMAKKLIAKGGMKLKEVATQIGYDDPFYFSRKFKKEIGVSPTEYMKRRSRKIAIYDRQLLGQVLALHMIPYAAPLHPKWTEYYYQTYGSDIPVHLNAYRHNVNWQSNIEIINQSNAEIVMVSDHLSEQEESQLHTKISSFIKVPSQLQWREQFTWIADSLGVSEEAVRWLHHYDWKVKQAKERLIRKFEQLPNAKVAIVRVFKNNLYLHWSKGIASALTEDLELTSFVEPNSNKSERISLAALREMEPSHLLLLIRQESETLAHWNELKHTSEWQEIEAVKRNQVHYLSSDPWLENSAYAQSRIIDQLVNIFL
ncbi:AraC family transcriptional regulator [Cytobacillus sp. FJAT-53684]|uniref:AraC family transcriptional regulator n=1 Tax=Cytobacillus mangrovibacter TaxID=3299024 RepID=A0ABW6K0N1_9BACI